MWSVLFLQVVVSCAEIARLQRVRSVLFLQVVVSGAAIARLQRVWSVLFLQVVSCARNSEVTASVVSTVSTGCCFLCEKQRGYSECGQYCFYRLFPVREIARLQRVWSVLFLQVVCCARNSEVTASVVRTVSTGCLLCEK